MCNQQSSDMFSMSAFVVECGWSVGLAEAQDGWCERGMEGWEWKSCCLAVLSSILYESFRGEAAWKKERKAETLKHLFLTSANGNSRRRAPRHLVFPARWRESRDGPRLFVDLWIMRIECWRKPMRKVVREMRALSREREAF